MINKDFDIEQIDLISTFLFKVLFPADFDVTKLESFSFDEDCLDLKFKLKDLISCRKFCEAEDLLFDEIDQHDGARAFLQLAVWFYCTLNEFEDKVLNENNFSRYEIVEGLKEIERMVIES